MLLNELVKARIAAMKERDRFKMTLLTTLVAEAAGPGLNDGKRDSTDEEVTKVIKKFISNVEDTIELVKDSDKERAELLRQEKALYEQFLPIQMTEAELTSAIKSILQGSDEVNIGMVMKALKTQYNGLYNGRDAQRIVKSL